MNKLLITGLIALGAVCFAPAKAHAQTIATFDVPFSKDINNVPVQGSSGSYHTVISFNSGTGVYTVTVTGNNDGNPPTSAVPGVSGPGPTPKSGVGTLSFNFNNGPSLINATGLSGSSNAYVGPVGGNFGGPNNVAFGGTGGVYAINSGLTLRFTAPDENSYVAPHGGNTFTGTFTLAQPLTSITSIAASYQDSGQQYTFTQQLVPEPATAAMALPGLLPMAPLALMALRRRRKVTSDVEADEAEA